MKMIEINLKLFATLTCYLPEFPEAFEVEEGTTVDALIDRLGVPKDQAKLIFINGRKQDSGYRLEAGDRVGIFPPVGGG